MNRDSESDQRFTIGLVDDVFTVLEKHGYQCTANEDRGHAVEVLGQLVTAHEGADE